jgi:hypothetical protein
MYTIFCLLEDRGGPFPVDIDQTRTVGHLKDAIRSKNPVTLATVDAKDLTLYHVNRKYDEKLDKEARDEQVNKALQDVDPLESLHKLSNLPDTFPDKENMVHIIVRLPPGESIRACDVAEMLRSAQLVRLPLPH